MVGGAGFELALVIRDAFPVTTFHTLVIPKRHVGGYLCTRQQQSTVASEIPPLQMHIEYSLLQGIES